MNCPSCDGVELHPVMTREGVEVDTCPQCRGVWLDKGEALFFSDDPAEVERKLELGLRHTLPGNLQSPRAPDTTMERFTYPDGPELDYCPQSGGLWLDAEDLNQLIAQERSIHLQQDQQVNQVDEESDAPVVKGAVALMPLPSMLLRSSITLVGLYGLLGLVLIVLGGGMGLGPVAILGIFAAIVFIEFLIAPWIMDLTIRWVYSTRPLPLEEMPEHLRAFVSRLIEQQGIKVPRFTLIEDGAPTAFTYGRVPNDARIVISQGLLDLLNEEEVEAVVAHEVGHVVHWDMLLMTLAQLVPMVLYIIGRFLLRIARGRSGAPFAVLGLILILLYFVAHYIVLFFSRVREYYADRFAGEVTDNPNALSTALIKIGYGLMRDPSQGGEGTKEELQEQREIAVDQRESRQQAIGGLGIFDIKTAKAVAVAGYGQMDDDGGDISLGSNQAKNIMRWDLWNPWATFYEWHSTHPLIAKRIRALGNQARHQGQVPFLEFDLKKPESYWDEFLVDFVVNSLPTLLFIPTLIVGLMALDHNPQIFFVLLLLFALARLLKFVFQHPRKFFPDTNISALLKKVKVSNVRSVPCRIEGTVIGRGEPGLIFSDDFIIRDQTGILYLDMRQPIPFWEMFFAVLKRGKFDGKRVVVEGWYRRAPVPYVEIGHIELDDEITKSWSWRAKWFFNWVMLFTAVWGLLSIQLGLF